ncbi:MAG: sodium:solute symporter family protein [Vulcanimicrobiaceae bacterium]
MDKAAVALGIVAIIVLGTIVFGGWMVRRVKMNPQEYMIGGRSFGPIFLWLLLAGEIYTTFTFLGAAGWAYGKGAPAFYILCYGTVAYIISYFLLPPIWRVAKDRGLLTGPDYLATAFDSKWLGVLVALVGFVFVVPYVTLQLTGIELLLRIAGYGEFNATVAVGIAFVLIALFIFVSGLRGAAWASVIKDTLVVLGVVFAGIILPIHFFGSPANVISHVLQTRPTWMTLAGATASNGTTWFVSTVMLTSLGFYMWPQSMSAIYSARSEDTLRRNAVFLPFYQLMLLLVYFAGFTALLVIPGLKASEADQSFMLVVQRYYAPGVLGLVAGAGVLAGLVPAAAQVLGAASVFTKNVLGDVFGIATSDEQRTLTTRILVLVVAGLALGFWLVAKTTLVGLLLIGYSGVTQFFPGVVFSLVWRRATALGVGAGIVAGIATVAYFAATKQPSMDGINTGFFALLINVVVCVVVSLISSPAREPDAQRLPT